MRGSTSGYIFVGLALVLGGCRTLRSSDAGSGWADLDAPSPECVLVHAEVEGDGDGEGDGEGDREDEALRVYARTSDVAERLAGAGLFGVDCAGKPFRGLGESWKARPGTALSFRGERLRPDVTDGIVVAGADSIRWEGQSVVVYGRDRGDVDSDPTTNLNDLASLTNLYTRLVQPAPDATITAAVDDERDLIDRGIDVLVTERTAVRDYAERSPAYRTVALPVTRLYVVVAPGGVALPAELASALAQGITAERRVVDSRDGAVCGMNSPGRDDDGGQAAGTPRRVLFDGSDSAARDLASRVVALSSQGRLAGDNRWQLTSVAADEDSLIEHLSGSADEFYVIRIRVPATDGVGAGAGCIAVPRELVETAGGRGVLPVAWVREYALVGPDVMLVSDIDGLPVARRAQGAMP